MEAKIIITGSEKERYNVAIRIPQSWVAQSHELCNSWIAQSQLGPHWADIIREEDRTCELNRDFESLEDAKKYSQSAQDDIKKACEILKEIVQTYISIEIDR